MFNYKNILIICFFLFTATLFAQDKVTIKKDILLKDFITHNSEKSCWILIDTKVYDVTSFLKDHPAPPKVLLKYCGKDASKGFKDKGIGEPHSKNAIQMLDKFFVGTLKVE